MLCPKCNCLDDKVIDSRISREGDTIRRRRECLRCGNRFTTYEMITRTDLIVVKRDGARQDFSPEKLRHGIRRACWKRPVGEQEIDQTVQRIAARFDSLQQREVTSEDLGEAVMDELQKLDQVAYVRFASVYRRFTDVDHFMKEIQKLTDDTSPVACPRDEEE